MTKVILVLALALSGTAVFGQTELEQRINNIISKLRGGEQVALQTVAFRQPRDAAVTFADRVDLLADGEHRLMLVRFIVALERNSLVAEKKRFSDSARILTMLVKMVERDKSETARATAAQALRSLFAVDVLDCLAPQIRAAAAKWKQEDILLLYALLPTASAKDMDALVRPLLREADAGQYALRSIVARFGDASAERVLIQTAAAIQSGSYVEITRLFDALSFVPSMEMKRYLARGLRSEEVIAMPGGCTIPKRNLFAHSLASMMEGRDGFPVAPGDLLFNDQELDQIEGWCAEKLGIRYPVGPRKHLVAVPSFEPLPQGKAAPP